MQTDDGQLPAFVTRKLERIPRTYLLNSPDEVRAHCLAADSIRHFTLTIAGKSFRYNVRKAKRHSAGWQVRAHIPLSQKKLLRDDQKRRPIALVGQIAADFSFKRRGKSLSDDDPIIRNFLEFHRLIFVRNVVRPAEMKIEATVFELATTSGSE
jgi:hypothetical protein